MPDSNRSLMAISTLAAKMLIKITDDIVPFSKAMTDICMADKGGSIDAGTRRDIAIISDQIKNLQQRLFAIRLSR